MSFINYYDETGNTIQINESYLLRELYKNDRCGSFMEHQHYECRFYKIIDKYVFFYCEGIYEKISIQCIGDECGLFINHYDQGYDIFLHVKLSNISKSVIELMKINGLPADKIAHNMRLLRDFVIKYVDLASDFSENYVVTETKSARS